VIFLLACTGVSEPVPDTRPPADTDAAADSGGSGDTSGDTGDAPADDTGEPDTGEPDTGEPEDPFPLLPAVPLSTQGRWIVDANGDRFKLASVNWYGFEELDYVPAGLELAHIDDIAAVIAELGFNSVRLPFSLEMVEATEPVTAIPIAANPQLEGLLPIEVMDAVIDALARQGVVVILDNHSSEAVWYSQENGLWYTDDYPEEVWISDWQFLAERYVDHPGVVGYDLRNELRSGATWGGPPQTDWKAAVERVSDAIFEIDTTRLIVVTGVGYGADFSGAYFDPLTLSVPDRLVYTPHDYSWFHGEINSYDDLAGDLGGWWGFLIVEDQPWTAPVWVGEFGTCNTSASCVQPSSPGGAWFEQFMAYLSAGDIDWAYWPLNGTMARADDREFGAVDWYGVLNETWTGGELPELVEALQAIQEPWAFPE